MYRYERKNDRSYEIDLDKPAEMPKVTQYHRTAGVVRGERKVYHREHDTAGKCHRIIGGYVQLKYGR